jgi:hypothetical protein
VAPAAYRDVEIERPGERQCVDDVGDAVTARDDRRIFVDQTVVHAATFVVAGVLALQQLSAERRDDLTDRFSEWWHDCWLSDSISLRGISC